MYTRVPPKKTQAQSTQMKMTSDPPIALPKNYSGNAFTEDGHKREFPSSDAPTEQFKEQEERKRPYVSPPIPPSVPSHTAGALGYSDYPTEITPQHNAHQDMHERSDEEIKEISEKYPIPTQVESIVNSPKSRGGSFFSAMLPDGVFKNNFPFGHGLGNEELLLLGIMLSIYMSGEADGELMMLLCILLFSG